jgi:hypothetical protein
MTVNSTFFFNAGNIIQSNRVEKPHTGSSKIEQAIRNCEKRVH